MERLLIERARRRMSLQELAARSGLNEHTISDLERGIRKPRATTVAKLAGALDISVEELLEVPKALSSSPKAVESPVGEEQYGSEDVWRKEYLARADEMLSKWEGELDDWEGELEEKLDLSDPERSRFLSWADEIAAVGRPLMSGIVSAYTATVRFRLEAVVRVAEFLQPWDDLWDRIEHVKERVDAKFTEEDEKRFHKAYEEAQQPSHEARRQGLITNGRQQ